MAKINTVKAAVGVIYNHLGQLLIGQRQKHQFMAGFWELPGGKIGASELPEQAIVRELEEELGIVVKTLSQHQTMACQYPDRKVLLSIYNIERYQGVATALEGQKLAWVALADLRKYPLLPTMSAFIHSITLADKYWITPANDHTSTAWMAGFKQKLTQRLSLIQLRSKVSLNSPFIAELHHKCQQNNAKLLLNIPNKTFNESHCDGWHLTTDEMLKLAQRPCASDKLLGASTHNLDEALHAQAMGVDFVVISPVKPTKTHPNAPAIGWGKAQEVAEKLNIPVYFLGGMTPAYLAKARNLGAQGIAGVSAF